MGDNKSVDIASSWSFLYCLYNQYLGWPLYKMCFRISWGVFLITDITGNSFTRLYVLILPVLLVSPVLMVLPLFWYYKFQLLSVSQVYPYCLFIHIQFSYPLLLSPPPPTPLSWFYPVYWFYLFHWVKKKSFCYPCY